VTGAKPQVELETYGPKVNELADRRSSVGADETKKKGKEFADNVAKQKDATTTPSGIVIRSITAGAGPTLLPRIVVKVQYEGKLIDGTVFDSSIQRGEPAEFPLNQVVPCWKEALQKLKRAGRRRLFVRRMSHMATMPAADHSPRRHTDLRSGAARFSQTLIERRRIRWLQQECLFRISHCRIRMA